MLNAPLPTTAQATITLKQEVAPTQPTPGGTFFAGIAYNATGQIYLSTLNDLYLLNNNLTITHVGAFSVAGVGSDLTSCNYPFSVLPVNLTNFTATNQANSVLLNWMVTSSEDLNLFEVERSTNNGIDWNSIGLVMGQEDNLNEQNYLFKDTRPEKGADFYRLAITDKNGSISYSSIKEIEISGDNQLGTLICYPNPVGAENKLNIQLTGFDAGIYSISLVSSSGQNTKDLKYNIDYSGSGMITLPTTGIAPGMYVVIVKGNKQQFSQSVVIQNK